MKTVRFLDALAFKTYLILFIYVGRVIAGGPALAVRRLVSVVRGRWQILRTRHGVQFRLVLGPELQDRLQMSYVSYGHPTREQSRMIRDN